jgi:hypothetical protein
MAEPSERKAELIAALAGSRAAFAHNFRGVRRDLDVPAHITHAFRRHKTLYLTGAAGIGWVLSRLPVRKKKVYVDRAENKKIKIKEANEMGFLGILFVVLKFVFSVCRPAIAAFATKKISTFAETHGPGYYPPAREAASKRGTAS